ncbi:membrane protein, partial [Streptomyces regensis]
HGPVWMVRRVLADFTEAPFYGNEIASIGLLLGTVLAFLLNPANPVYGDGVLPAMLTAQVATSTLGVLLYRSRWIARGWYPTFVPVVSVAPATVLTYGAGVHTVVAGAVVGALIGPPVAAWISERLPSDFHPFIGNVVSMAVGTLVAVPVLGLLPGFG